MTDVKRNLIILAIATACLGVVAVRHELKARAIADASSLPDLLNLAPADSTFIAYSDVAALRQSPLIQQVEALAKPATMDRDYADFVSATGFDYERDLDHVVLATRPDGSAQETFAFAEGRFDQKKIEAYASRSGKIQNQNGRTVYVVPSTTAGKSVSLSFLSPNRIAVSEGGNIFAAPGGFSAAPLDPALRERLSRVAGAPFFFTAKMPARGAMGASNPVAASVSSLFESIRWLDVAARPDGDNLILSAEGECGTPDQAQKVASTLELLRAVVEGALANPNSSMRLPADSAATAERLLKAASITSTADRVRLLITVTSDMLHLPGAAAPAPPLQHPANR